MADVDPIPAGCNTVNVYLVVKDGHAAIEFYKKAFGATGGSCMPGPDGKGIMHADLKLGNSTIMLTEENPQWGMTSAETMGGSPVSMHMYVDNVDEFYQNAVDAGCTSESPLMDMFWGDRMAKLSDPFGYKWSVATQIEVVSDEDMEVRAQEWFKQMADQS